MHSSVFWNIQLTRGFKKPYGKLSLKDKWIVKHFLNDIRYLKDPRHPLPACILCSSLDQASFLLTRNPRAGKTVRGIDSFVKSMM